MKNKEHLCELRMIKIPECVCVCVFLFKIYFLREQGEEQRERKRLSQADTPLNGTGCGS